MSEGLLRHERARGSLHNAIRLACFHNAITQAQAEASWARVAAHVSSGWLVPVPWQEDVFPLAERLAGQNPRFVGSRSLDLLHVAALANGASIFFTRDQRPAALARAAGLRVRPAP